MWGGDDIVQQRLDAVSKILGQRVSLKDPPEEDQDEPGTSAAADPLQWQRDAAAEPKQDEEAKEKPEQEDGDAPKRFFGHDAGPRANVQDVFDDSKLVAGEPVDASAEFCPWKMVKAYPYTFVGKTNRPHVEPLFDDIFKDRVWDV